MVFPDLTWPVLTWRSLIVLSWLNLSQLGTSWLDLSCLDLFWLYVFWLYLTWLDRSSSWNWKFAFKQFKHPLFTLSLYCLDTICIPCIHSSGTFQNTFQTPSSHPQDTHQTPSTNPWWLLIPKPWFKIIFTNFKLGGVVSWGLGGFHPNNRLTS